MSGKYLKYIPRTLQEDFIDNRVLPFVGAGFSKMLLPQKEKIFLIGKDSGKRWQHIFPTIPTQMP